MPEEVLDAWGATREAGEIAGVEGAVLAAAIAEGPGRDVPPGLYAGLDRRVALNVIGAETVLAAAEWPAGVVVETLEVAAEKSLKGPLLAAGLALLLVDILAALLVAGRVRPGCAGGRRCWRWWGWPSLARPARKRRPQALDRATISPSRPRRRWFWRMC